MESKVPLPRINSDQACPFRRIRRAPGPCLLNPSLRPPCSARTCLWLMQPALVRLNCPHTLLASSQNRPPQNKRPLKVIKTKEQNWTGTRDQNGTGKWSTGLSRWEKWGWTSRLQQECLLTSAWGSVPTGHGDFMGGLWKKARISPRYEQAGPPYRWPQATSSNLEPGAPLLLQAAAVLHRAPLMDRAQPQAEGQEGRQEASKARTSRLSSPSWPNWPCHFPWPWLKFPSTLNSSPCC